MKKLFMAVIALMMTLSASAQFYIYYSDGNVIKVDSISMIAPADAEDPTNPDNPTNPNNPSTPSQGIGVFSVSATKQVTFSPGNLQYTQSTNTWSFAENQWEMLGTDNVRGGSVSSDPTYGDNKRGDALADKVDLFGWSTGATNFGVSTSTDWENDYLGSFVDWGTNKIGNDAPNTWRTLTRNEWYYLRYNRPNADSLVSVAQVNGINGLIFLPDNWTCPSGVTFKSGFHSYYDVDYYAAYQSFTADQWSKLEATGAVFLPAAGYRRGSNVYLVQCDGDYWSATEYNSNHAYYLGFSSKGASMVDYNRYDGRSVRLVKDIEWGTTPDTPTQPDVPTPDTMEIVIPEEAMSWNIPAEALTVAEAREICAGLESGAKTSQKYYVMGYVKKIHSKHADGVANYGNAQFYMEDVKGANSADDFMAYQVYGPNNQKITEIDAVAVGDFVVIYGPLTNYNGTYETTGQGSACIWKSTNPLLSGTSQPQEPEELIIPEAAKAWNIPAEAIDVIKAREICASLAAGDSTEEKYYVMGYVKKIHSKHADGVANYGNAQFYMENVKGKDSQNDFIAFQVYGLNGTKITDPNSVAVGDFVVVYGKLTNFMGNTYETVGKGSAYVWKSTNPLMVETKPEEQDPMENGHEYVDLGLSVKWATCNVGASKPEEYGDYFAWGETEPKSIYEWSTYKWCNGSYYTQTKYCTNSSYGTVDNKTQLELSDDAARANWGGSWRMPTKAEQDELREQCIWSWTTQNGVNGYKVTSKKNGNSIFLPAAGSRNDSSLYGAGSSGIYWSSSFFTDYPGNAYYLSFSSHYVDWFNAHRFFGHSVRPVCQ